VFKSILAGFLRLFVDREIDDPGKGKTVFRPSDPLRFTRHIAKNYPFVGRLGVPCAHLSPESQGREMGILYAEREGRKKPAGCARRQTHGCWRDRLRSVSGPDVLGQRASRLPVLPPSTSPAFSLLGPLSQ